MEDDPFEPSATQAQPGDPGIAKQWGEYLADPKGRAALMQMGISMLQPVGVGQSELGHIASAIGQGGEAVGRMEDRDLREKAINLRGERTTQSLTNAAERLGIAQEQLRLSQMKTAGTSGAQTDAAASRTEAAKRKFFLDLAEKDFKHMLSPSEAFSDPEFMAKAEKAWQASKGTAGAGGLPPKTELKAGQVYEVPGRGQMKWTGTGFVKP